MADDFNSPLGGLDFSSLFPPQGAVAPPTPLRPGSLRGPAPQGQNALQQMMPLLMMLPALMKGGSGQVGTAAFLQGMQQAQQRRQGTQQQQFQNNRLTQQDEANASYRQQQLDAQQQAQQNGFRQRVMSAANGIETPEGARALLDFLGPEAQQLGIPRSTVEAYVMETATPAKLIEKQVRKVLKEAKPEHIDQWQQARGSLMVNGKPVPYDVWSQFVTNAVDAQGNRIVAAPKPTDKRGFATKDVTVNGRRMLAGFDPDTNQYFAPGDTQTPLTGDIQEYNKPQTPASGVMAGTDAEAIADAIINGEQPPTLQGLYRVGAPVRSILAKKGFNLSQAETDWKATQKHVATLNGPQQLRMHQAIDNAAHSLDVIEDLAAQWKGGKFPALNKGRLAAARQGLLGPAAQQIATQLEAQIADVTSELGNVYMGGNSPTDHSLGLAAKNMQANWSEPQLLAALKLARTNLQIRGNSMKNVGVAGASQGNQYAAPTPAADEGPASEWVRDKSGKLVKRGGK